MSEQAQASSQWHTICSIADLNPDGGICALVENQQIAVFYDAIGDNLHAISNYDPIGKANVLSRGIVGSLQGRPVVASPLYKQHFDLITGECLEDADVCVQTFDARVHNDNIQIRNV